MIILASNNKGKVKEIKELLEDEEIKTLEEMNIEIDIEEDGNTFEENALKKAREIYKLTKLPCIADDSGICIKELNGFPGVRTARFLGDKATQEDRNKYILEKMKEKSGEERNAKVVCDIAYVDDNNTIVVEGIIEGKISREERGKKGFGFDNIFELEDGRTLAELTTEEKNKVSSRKIALEKLKKKLEE